MKDAGAEAVVFEIHYCVPLDKMMAYGKPSDDICGMNTFSGGLSWKNGKWRVGNGPQNRRGRRTWRQGQKTPVCDNGLYYGNFSLNPSVFTLYSHSFLLLLRLN